MNYKELRSKYPEFVYKEYGYEIKENDLVVKFLFQVGADIRFRPTLTLKNIPLDRCSALNKNTFDNLLFHLGLVEIPSYWKATCSPKIVVEAGYLDEFQLNWWRDLLINGMGQFFYENKIDFTSRDFVSVVSKSDKKHVFGASTDASGILVPVGGGKDSAVTLELLKGMGHVAALLINPTQAANDVVEVSGLDKKIIIERALDSKLLKLNTEGYLNGHTPFSSLVAFVAVLAAYIYGYKDIALANERSSDEENTTFLGRKINHQYSKTLDFENKFRDYTGKYLTDINYFSFLRPVYEIQISNLFSKMKKYFSVFRSCNVGQKTNSWCTNCSKCLSTYILLQPFLSPAELTSIFGEDLLTKPSLKGTLSELIDEDKVKPFECVGTRKELRDALDSKLKILTSWNSDNNLPDSYAKLLRDEIQK